MSERVFTDDEEAYLKSPDIKFKLEVWMADHVDELRKERANGNGNAFLAVLRQRYINYAKRLLTQRQQPTPRTSEN